jgi:glutaminyl-peptide cyclotransferase
MMKRLLSGASLLILVMLCISPTLTSAQDENPLGDPIEMLVPEVISVYDHDPAAYTQGLLMYDGTLYESAGQYGESTLRQVELETGDVLRSIDIPEEYFAEGLERVGDKLIQLTWQEHIAFIYDLETFEQVGSFAYEGEGWGLCFDGTHLFLSDGSPFLTLRDPETFEPIFSGLVTVQGSPVQNINELECVDDYIYANVWKTNYILKIDKQNGVVVAAIDASGLLSEEESANLDAGAEVLNGIAYNPKTDTFLLTGKHWPKIFEVRFVPAPQ